MTGKYVTCSSCRGSGQKRGTTLTCYDCAGLGVIPDTRETFRMAREEIGEAQEEMARERPARLASRRTKRARLAAKRADRPKSKKHKFSDVFSKRKSEEDEETNFCQCCGDKVNESMTIKICLDCFGKAKESRAYKE